MNAPIDLVRHVSHNLCSGAPAQPCQPYMFKRANLFGQFGTQGLLAQVLTYKLDGAPAEEHMTHMTHLKHVAQGYDSHESRGKGAFSQVWSLNSYSSQGLPEKKVMTLQG